MCTMDYSRLNRLGELLEESVQAGQIAGGNLCVLHRGEEVYYAEAGYADIANQRKMKRDSIFRLYSMTKPITSAAVMLLMERGVIDLLDPVSKYIPTFAGIRVAAPEGDVAANRPVTVKDCLSMTSGLTYNCDPDPASRDAALVYDELDRRLYSDSPMTTMEMASKMGQGRLAYQPGEGWRYGTSADILGAVVEAASGVRFGEFLKREFFEPLHMKDTGFCLDASKRDRLTKVYEVTGDGLAEYHGNHLGICNHMDADIQFESGGAGRIHDRGLQAFCADAHERGNISGQNLSVTVDGGIHDRLPPVSAPTGYDGRVGEPRRLQLQQPDARIVGAVARGDQRFPRRVRLGRLAWPLFCEYARGRHDVFDDGAVKGFWYVYPHEKT